VMSVSFCRRRQKYYVELSRHKKGPPDLRLTGLLSF
jgi:hypothetical protein